jgi:hypothetical protein
MALHGLIGDSFAFLYVVVRTSQETPMALHGLLRDAFTLLFTRSFSLPLLE